MGSPASRQRLLSATGVRGMSVGARILLSATLSFLVIGFCAFKMWRNLSLLAQTQEWVAHTNKVVATTNQALSALVDIETGSRGFSVGGAANFLEPYEAGKTAFAKSIEAAKALVADNPAQVERFQKLADSARAWVDGPVAEDIAGRKAVASGAMNEDAFVASFNQAHGKKLMDQMRAQAAEIVGIEEALLAQRDEAYHAAVADSRLWGSWIIGGAIACGWGLLFYIGRGAQNVLKRVSATLDEASSQVSTSAGEVAAASQMLAQGASEQAASLEETSASLEEINSQAKRNGDNADSARDLAREATEATEQGTAQMREMVTAMDEIKTSSGNIAKIVKTIDEIAF